MNRNQLLFQIIGSLLLVFWGGVFIYHYQVGTIEEVLRRFFPMAALIGGIAMIILGLFNLFTIRFKVEDCGSCCGHEHEHGHDHEHEHEGHHHHAHGDCHAHDHDHHHGHAHKHHDEDEVGGHHHEQDTMLGLLVTVCILVIPFGYAAAYAPGGFSAKSVDKKGAQLDGRKVSEAHNLALRDLSREKVQESKATEANSEKDGEETTTNYYDPYTIDDVRERVGETEDGALLLDVAEIYYTAGDREMQKILDGHAVEFTAQIIPQKTNNPLGNRLRAMTLYVQCCLADAQPYAIPIEFENSAPEYREMGWYKVQGSIDYRTEDGMTIPVIGVTKFEETDEPAKDNMYF